MNDEELKRTYFETVGIRFKDEELVTFKKAAVDLNVNLSQCHSFAEAREDVLIKAFDKVLLY